MRYNKEDFILIKLFICQPVLKSERSVIVCVNPVF